MWRGTGENVGRRVGGVEREGFPGQAGQGGRPAPAGEVGQLPSSRFRWGSRRGEVASRCLQGSKPAAPPPFSGSRRAGLLHFSLGSLSSGSRGREAMVCEILPELWFSLSCFLPQIINRSCVRLDSQMDIRSRHIESSHWPI